MKKFAIIAAIATTLSVSAHAQAIKDVVPVVVVETTCTTHESESIVGGAVGAAGGAVAGRVLGGLFGSTGKHLGTIAGGMGGALLGNEMAKNTVHTCEVIVQDTQQLKYMVNYSGNTPIKNGDTRKLYVLVNGQTTLK